MISTYPLFILLLHMFIILHLWSSSLQKHSPGGCIISVPPRTDIGENISFHRAIYDVEAVFTLCSMRCFSWLMCCSISVYRWSISSSCSQLFLSQQPTSTAHTLENTVIDVRSRSHPPRWPWALTLTFNPRRAIARPTHKLKVKVKGSTWPLCCQYLFKHQRQRHKQPLTCQYKWLCYGRGTARRAWQ